MRGATMLAVCAAAATVWSSVFAAPSLSPKDEALFAEGVAAYERGEPGESERVFRELLSDGVVHPDVLFNLGNAAYRQGRQPVAVWAYEWARELAPRDEDLLENLAMARGKLIADEFPTEVPEAALEALRILRAIPPVIPAALFVTAWSVGWILMAVRQWKGARGLTVPGAALVLASLVALMPVVLHVLDERRPPRGVLQWDEVSVTSGPGSDYATLFSLHAGTVVERLEERRDWSHVVVPHGPEGWIPTHSLALFGRPDMLPPVPD